MHTKFIPKNRPTIAGFHRFGDGTRGFTLIELLVVITIIAILLSLLIPTIGYIKFIATGNVCVNRQKQTVLGILMYAADNRGEMPYVIMGAWNYYQGKQNNHMGFVCNTTVNGMIYPYVGTMKIAQCAADYPWPEGHAASFNPDWGQHTEKVRATDPDLCPDSKSCRGRSNSYGAWVGNEDISAGVNTHIMDATRGCKVSQYIIRMKNSYYMSNRYPDPINRYTGRTAAGADPRIWTWNEVWGSALLSEMWMGFHRYGNREASAQANIEGAAKFRIYRKGEYAMPPNKQLTRYEEE